MIAPRISSNMLVGALRRLAEMQGGFATVLAKGDDGAGAIMLVVRDSQGNQQLLERILDLDGKYMWRPSGNKDAPNDESVQKFLEQRRRSDPDTWILELTIASAERFVAQLVDLD